ncbi:MAG: hypothetical protein AAF623_06565 [Planctomycetota bacterium]
MKNWVWFFLVSGLLGQTLGAQELFLKNQLESSAANPGDPVKFSAKFELKPQSLEGMVSLTAVVENGWHIYSVTQPKGGPMRSKISVAESKDFQMVGEFTPNRNPKINRDTTFDVAAEEHEGTVVWSAPIRLAEGVKPESLEIKLVFNGQVCESRELGSCLPLFDIKQVAQFAGYREFKMESKTVVSEPFLVGETHAKVSARVMTSDGKSIQPGGKFVLEITATPLEQYHVYSYETGKCDFMATRIGFTQSAGMKISKPKSSTQPHVDNSLGIEMKYHHGEVKWTFDVELDQNIQPEDVNLVGLIGLQTCDDEQCDPPAGAQFAIKIPVGTNNSAAAEFEDSSYSKAKKAQAAFLAK